MVELSKLVGFLDKLLPPNGFADSSLNGLQVESSTDQIARIGFAVDAGSSIIEKAVRARCQMLIVHHGLLWGHEQPIRATFGKKIDLLLAGGCSLYASHLPLDASALVGNNVELARYFKLNLSGSFGRFQGKDIGVTAKVPGGRSRALEAFVERAKTMTGAMQPLVLPFGKKQIKTVGIISGSGSSAIAEASALKLDLFISGEPKQHAYHDAKEQGINVIFAGHYATETFGVLALAKQLKKKFKIHTTFINEPTGI